MTLVVLTYLQMPCRHAHPEHISCGQFFLPGVLQQTSSPHQGRRCLYLLFPPAKQWQDFKRQSCLPMKVILLFENLQS